MLASKSEYQTKAICDLYFSVYTIFHNRNVYTKCHIGCNNARSVIGVGAVWAGGAFAPLNLLAVGHFGHRTESQARMPPSQYLPLIFGQLPFSTAALKLRYAYAFSHGKVGRGCVHLSYPRNVFLSTIGVIVCQRGRLDKVARAAWFNARWVWRVRVEIPRLARSTKPSILRGR